MGQNTDNSNTDTIPIPLLDIERKTLPVMCPKCNRITGIAEIDVRRDMMISPLYRMCGKFMHLFRRGQGE